MTNNASMLEKQPCPFCHTDNLTLTEEEKEVPYFGNVFLFSMSCSNCKYHKSDVECAEQKPPVKFTIDIDCEEDMNIRVIKSSEATVKISHIASITPGPASDGYISNVEGVLNRVKEQVEIARNEAEDDAEKKKAKNMIKKIQNIIWGHEKTRIILEDPTGNSAIISDKAMKSKL